jgi:CRISPR-associated exonuclease Cas4
MYSESDLLPLSAIQHIAFCERQCALIHIEQAWEENRLTAEGRILHERVHEKDSESRPGVRIARGLRIRSYSLGISGIADVVEFHKVGNGDACNVSIPGSDELWIPFPVEYKRGKPKVDHCDMVQLCAQAICLEEMLGAHIECGALFYAKPRRRMDVAFDQMLRAETEECCARLHKLISAGITPPAMYEKKCRSCSLAQICMPQASSKHKDVSHYLKSAVEQS